jgi:hypothetical protein
VGIWLIAWSIFSSVFLFANKVSSTVCNVSQFTASDMSDLSYEQELGEVGEGGEVSRPLATL